MPHAACRMPHAGGRRQQAACRMQEAAGSRQHTTRDGIPHTPSMLTHVAMHIPSGHAPLRQRILLPSPPSSASLLPPSPPHSFIATGCCCSCSHHTASFRCSSAATSLCPSRTERPSEAHAARRTQRAACRALFGATGCTGPPEPEPCRAGPGRAGPGRVRSPQAAQATQRRQAAVDGSLPVRTHAAPCLLSPAPCPLSPAP